MRALRCCWLVVALAPLFVGCTKSATVANRDRHSNSIVFDEDKKPNQAPKRQPTKPDICVSGGAVLFAGAMVFLRPTSKVWLPHALEVSAERYGTIGVAFTYLAWLYVLSFCFLAAGVIGQVLTTDAGWLGRRLRGRDVTAKGEV